MESTTASTARKRKPRKRGGDRYSDEERRAAEARLATALAVTASADKPEGNTYHAALAAGLPRTTAQEWMDRDDEGFATARRQYKRAFHGEALRLLGKLTAAVHEAIDDPERRAKANIRDLTIAAATWYDKAALAAGEGQVGAVAALAAGVAIGRAVERGRVAPAGGVVEQQEAIDITSRTWEPT